MVKCLPYEMATIVATEAAPIGKCHHVVTSERAVWELAKAEPADHAVVVQAIVDAGEVQMTTAVDLSTE